MQLVQKDTEQELFFLMAGNLKNRNYKLLQLLLKSIQILMDLLILYHNKNY